jgi:hypothetical protein
MNETSAFKPKKASPRQGLCDLPPPDIAASFAWYGYGNQRAWERTKTGKRMRRRR